MTFSLGKRRISSDYGFPKWQGAAEQNCDQALLIKKDASQTGEDADGELLQSPFMTDRAFFRAMRRATWGLPHAPSSRKVKAGYYK